jgi:hypothetical protein
MELEIQSSTPQKKKQLQGAYHDSIEELNQSPFIAPKTFHHRWGVTNCTNTDLLSKPYFRASETQKSQKNCLKLRANTESSRIPTDSIRNFVTLIDRDRINSP